MDIDFFMWQATLGRVRTADLGGSQRSEPSSPMGPEIR